MIADKGERNSRKRIEEQKANAGDTRGSEEMEGGDVIVADEDEDMNSSW